MIHTIKALAAAVLAVFLCALPAQAQQACTSRAKWVEVLGGKYQEHPVNSGTMGAGKNVIEVFASQTRSFTIIATDTNGLSCIVAAGQNWDGALPGPVKEGI